MGLLEDAPHSDLTYRVIGLAMAVHNDLGPGHREAVYQRALAAKLRDADLVFGEEPCISVEMEDGTVVGLYYPDFIVEGAVIVEIKALSHPLTNDDVAQVVDYFSGTDCGVALLINFGRRRLEWRRLFPPRKIREHRRKKWGKQLA
jgi:GxxExxY protein